MKNKNIYKKVFGILLIIIILLLTYFVGKYLLNELSNIEDFKNKIDGYGIFGKIVFIIIAIIQVLLALIPSEAVEIAGGYAFGSIEGMFLCLLGVTLGSIIVILLTKKFGRKFVNLFYDDNKIDNFKLFKDEKKLSKLLFILFLVPGTPKDLITYVVGLTDLKLSTYLILTTIARIPNIIVSTLAGNAIANNNINNTILFLLLSLISGIIGYLVYKFYLSKKEDL